MAEDFIRIIRIVDSTLRANQQKRKEAKRSTQGAAKKKEQTRLRGVRRPRR